MTAPIMVAVALACLTGAFALTLAGIRYLFIRPANTLKSSAQGSERTVPTPAQGVGNAPATVVVDGIGALAVEDGVLLNTLWEHLPNADCQSGECGGCKMRLLEGEVRWIREPQAALDRSTHFLACSCEAIGPLKCATL